MRHDRSREGDAELDRYNDELDMPNDDLGEASRHTEGGLIGALTDNEDDPERALRETKEEDSKKPIAWRELPQKRQLIIITLARLSEPLVQTSLQVKNPFTDGLTLGGILVLTRRQCRHIYSTSSNGSTRPCQTRPSLARPASCMPASWEPSSSPPCSGAASPTRAVLAASRSSSSASLAPACPA